MFHNHVDRICHLCAGYKVLDNHLVTLNDMLLNCLVCGCSNWLTLTWCFSEHLLPPRPWNQLSMELSTFRIQHKLYKLPQPLANRLPSNNHKNLKRKDHFLRHDIVAVRSNIINLASSRRARLTSNNTTEAEPEYLMYNASIASWTLRPQGGS